MLDFLICHRTLDGIRLAAEIHARSKHSHLGLLLVVPGGDPSAALALGLDPERNTLLDYLAGSQVTPVRGTDGLLVLSDWGLQSSCSETMGKLFSQVDQGAEQRVLALFLLDRLEDDLPPLPEGSRLSFFWNVSDMLSEKHLERFEYASERMEVESPRNGGFFLYQEDNASLDSRASAIEEVFHSHCKLQRFSLPKGTPWHQAAYS